MNVISDIAFAYYTQTVSSLVYRTINKSTTNKRVLQAAFHMAVSVAFLVTNSIVVISLLCSYFFCILFALPQLIFKSFSFLELLSYFFLSVFQV